MRNLLLGFNIWDNSELRFYGGRVVFLESGNLLERELE